MSTPAEQLLDIARANRAVGPKPMTEAERILAEHRSTKIPVADGGIVNTLSRYVAQPFNQGLLALPELLPGGDSLQADASRLGFTAPEGAEVDGIVPHIMEILGGSALPGGLISGFGKQVVARGVPLVEQTVLEALASMTARHPVANAVGEVTSAVGAGTAGEIAEEFTDDPAKQTLAELAGGFGPSVIPAAGRLAGKVANNLPSVVIGKKLMDALSAVSAPNRAAREIQSRAVNPEESAARIDVQSPMPPARQAGDPRLLALEEAVLRQSDPAKPETVQRHINQTVETAKQAATNFGPDMPEPVVSPVAAQVKEEPIIPVEAAPVQPEPKIVAPEPLQETVQPAAKPENARAVIERQGKRTVEVATKRADAAIAEAEKALQDITPATDPHDISRVVREKVKTAYDQARVEEKKLWDEVDSESVGNLKNLKTETQAILDETGKFNKGKAVPKVIRAALALEKKLAKKGETINFRDIHGLRQQIQSLKAKAVTEPGNAAEIRVLTRLEHALLEDMSATNAEGVSAARDFSRQLNDKFTRGKMGQVLGFSERGMERVLDADTLSSIMSGQYPARNVEQLINAAPEAKADAVDFIRKNFILQTTKDGVVDQRAAKRVIESLRSKRMFEVFPELEQQLSSVGDKSARAATLKERAAIVKARGGARLEKGSKESLASLMLDKPVGEEAGLLLDAKKTKNPVQMARRLVSRLEGNEHAKQGLRTAFSRSLMTAANSSKTDTVGEAITSGAKYTKLLKDNLETLKALGFSEPEIQRMKKTALVLRQAENKSDGGDSGAIMSDWVGGLLSNAARIAGAKAATFVNKALPGTNSAGTSLQIANIGASNAQKFFKFLTRDRARELLIEAHDDPTLYKALLLRNSDTPRAKKEAWSRLNAWMAGVALDGEEEPLPTEADNGSED